MAIVTETIRVVVSGANPQTKTFAVQVDTSTGAGVNPLSIPLTGVNAGTDTIQAFMDSHSLSSNNATLVWQGTNGPIAVGSVTYDTWNANHNNKGWPGFLSGAGSFGRVFPYLNSAPGANSLIVNQVIPNYPISGFNSQPTNVGPGGGYKLCPAVVVQQTSTGTFSSKLTINGTGDGAGGNADNGSDHSGFLLSVYGSLVVKTAGTYTIYGKIGNEGSVGMWISGVTVSSVVGLNESSSECTPYPAISPKFGYTQRVLVNTNSSEQSPVPSSYVTFPTAGVYPYEIVWNQHDEQQFSGDNNCYFEVEYLSGTQNQSSLNGNSTSLGPQMFPVALAAAPPTGSTPTGQLRLTPVGGNANLVIQGGSTNLTLTVQGVTYSSIPYCPIFEGTAGNLTVTNSGTQFVFPTYNGQVVNTTAAASQVFSITADNSAYMGLFTVTSTGAAPAPFKFNYNGGAFTFAVPGSQVASSQITVTADDIAWFDPNGTKFDTFNGGSGGTAFAIDVDYMVKPSIASVTPATLNASGKAQAVQINLSKPMSPQQQGLYGTGNTVVPNAIVSGGATIGTLTPILDSAGFLQGWSTSITPPLSSTNGSINLTMTVTGTLTYLSGNTFVTNTVTYISGQVTAIPTLGGFVAPVGVSLSTVPASTTLQTAGAPTNTPQPIRRAWWGNGLVGGNGAGNVITIMGEGRGTLFPSTLVVGAQVTLTGFQNPFPKGSGITGQSGSSQAGPQIAVNINGTYTVNLVTSAVVGGSEVCPCFTITAPQVGGSTRSYDWGSTVNPPDSGWFFTAPASSAGTTTIIGTEYTFDNPSSCTMQFFKKFINPASAAMNIGSPTSSPSAQTTTTVGGQTVYQKTYQINYIFPVVTTSVSTGGQINLGFVVTDNTTGLSTTYQSTTTYYEPINLVSGGGGSGGSGGGGGGGGCFTAAVGIETPMGCLEFGDLPVDRPFEIVNKMGTFEAELIIHENYKGWMLELAPGKLVTEDHLMMLASEDGVSFVDLWTGAKYRYPDAKRVWFEGTVYNLHVLTENLTNRHYILWNGDVAHNVKVL